MQRLIGNTVDVHLKFDDVVSGILFDVDEDNVYIQNDVNIFVAIPKENIKYYVSGATKAQTQVTTNPSPTMQQDINVIKVFVDNAEITTISIPPDLDISTCSEKILTMVWGDNNVKQALEGRVQKALEYDIGVVNILTTSSNISLSI